MNHLPTTCAGVLAAVAADHERLRREVEFLEILSDGGKLTVNDVPWREMFDRLNAIVGDPV